METHGELFVSSTLPPKSPKVVYMLRVPNQQPIEMTVISPDPLWIKTHWLNYRTVRCIPNDLCPHCGPQAKAEGRELSGRWRGFLAVSRGRGRAQEILEFSRDAFDLIEGTWKDKGTLRACVLEAKREFNHEKSALLLRFVTMGSVGEKVTPVAVMPTLLRMYAAKNRRSRKDGPAVQ